MEGRGERRKIEVYEGRGKGSKGIGEGRRGDEK